MKLLTRFAICFLLTCPVLAGAQTLPLEHSYGPIVSVSAAPFFVEGEGYKYVYASAGNSQINIYNSNHTLWKTITPVLPSGYWVTNILSVSTKLFDNDNGIEIAYHYNSSSISLMVINEDGTIIHRADTLAAYGQIKKIDGTWKLLQIGQGTFKVFALPGSLPGEATALKPEGKNQGEALIYPNPVTETATIDYTLPAGAQRGTIDIYSTAGTKVKSYTVTSYYHNITIDREELPAGSYIYQLCVDGYRGPAQQFTLR